jgi:ribosome-binding protein aMBF1 (putative translation factor)
MASLPRKARTASLHEEAYARFIRLLVEKRVRSGLSQQALADKLGWNQSIIAKIETAQRRLDIIELIRIARAVGFDPARIVHETKQDMAKRGEI